MVNEILDTGSSLHSEIAKVKQHLDAAFKGIREEFDEHLESINDNTNEVQANYEYICRLDTKIDRLAEKLDELTSRLSTVIPLSHYDDDEPLVPKIELTQKEKEVFLILYASEEKPLTYKDIARIMGDSDLLISGYITNLIEKGIPVMKKYLGHSAYLMLDRRFREMQAKNNMLAINQTTVKQFF